MDELTRLLIRLRLQLHHAAQDGDITACDILHGHIETVESAMELLEETA